MRQFFKNYSINSLLKIKNEVVEAWGFGKERERGREKDMRRWDGWGCMLGVCECHGFFVII